MITLRTVTNLNEDELDQRVKLHLLLNTYGFAGAMIMLQQFVLASLCLVHVAAAYACCFRNQVSVSLRTWRTRDVAPDACAAATFVTLLLLLG